MRKLLIILAFFMVIPCFCGCADTLGRDYGEPVNILADAVNQGDTEKYLSAFESKYIEDLTEFYDMASDDSLENILTDVLTTTKDYNKELSGWFMKINLTEKSKSTLDELPEDKSFTVEFKPEGEVEEITEICFEYTVSGFSGKSETKEATFVVYKVNGKYYLHPQHMFFVFQ